ncbi:GNAT family N-acetyltransferase (plasmid) [Pseudoalteromonas sp. T1lg65]|uniref:GNAT family N-acetyltransferase n=1 Tax=Pseudoalteromonas sp. T1lg65 TaxID=2077101 RepID=UPI003F793D48
MDHAIVIRKANENDHAFIFELSPRLAEVAQLDWHTDDAVQEMQDNYISEMLAQTSTPNTTLIAESENTPLGFIHVRTGKDGITGENCGTVPLLAVLPKAQGLGVGRALMAAAEGWAKKLGCRLLHLEVFASNSKANSFYQNLGFKPEMLHMVKTIE